MADTDTPPLPATFDFLVASLRIQAEVQLGMLRLGEENPPEPNLPMARHSIDMLAMLEEKTRGNLTLEEERDLKNCLTELRFRYVQVAERLAAEKAKKDAGESRPDGGEEKPAAAEEKPAPTAAPDEKRTGG
jgi:hypothetical protein